MRRNRPIGRLWALAAVVYGLAFCPPVPAQMWILTQTFHNPTPSPGDQFGWSMVTVGDNVFISAATDDTWADIAGCGYLFDAVTGRLLRTINNPSPQAGDRFGGFTRVGPNVLCGHPYDMNYGRSSGAAYLFDGTSGELITELAHPTRAFGLYFYSSRYAYGDTVLVASQPTEPRKGSAVAPRVYSGVTGQLLYTLPNPSPVSYDDRFYHLLGDGPEALIAPPNGHTLALYDIVTGRLVQTYTVPKDDIDVSDIAMNSNRVIWSSEYTLRGPNDPATAFGEVNVFDRATGALLRTIENPTGREDEAFGCTVELLGNGNFTVGASYDDTMGEDAGALHLFSGDSGDLIKTIYSPRPEAEARWGSATAVGDDFLVAQSGDDTLGPNTGALHLYDGDTGELLRSIFNPHPSPDTRFPGARTLIGTDYVLCTATWDNTMGEHAGAVYLFDLHTGQLVQSFFSPQPFPGEEFGYRVRLDNERLFIASEGWEPDPSGGTLYMYEIQPVPEPSTLAGVITLGIVGLLAYARRRRQFTDP